MPTWTDLAGAALVLGTVMAITLEKKIVGLCSADKSLNHDEELGVDSKT